MDEPPSDKYRPRRLTALCAAAMAAALFTPVPATADVIDRPSAQAIVRTSTIQADPPPQTRLLAQALISTGMIGIGLSMGGLVIVAHRRRRY